MGGAGIFAVAWSFVAVYMSRGGRIKPLIINPLVVQCSEAEVVHGRGRRRRTVGGAGQQLPGSRYTPKPPLDKHQTTRAGEKSPVEFVVQLVGQQLQFRFRRTAYRTGKISLTLGSWHQESRAKAGTMRSCDMQCRSYAVGQMQCGHGRGRDYAVTCCDPVYYMSRGALVKNQKYTLSLTL